jgi:bacterioferritin
MKGNDAVVAKLNQALAEELTAINQYMVHSEMCANWGYAKLHEAIEKQAIDEMRHAEWLIARILFLEGIPIVSTLHAIRIGKTAEEMVVNDLNTEYAAVRLYNEGVKLAEKSGDAGTRELLTKILEMEEAHVDWGEAQRDQIAQMGFPTYLAQQLVKD